MQVHEGITQQLWLKLTSFFWVEINVFFYFHWKEMFLFRNTQSTTNYFVAVTRVNAMCSFHPWPSGIFQHRGNQQTSLAKRSNRRCSPSVSRTGILVIKEPV